MTDQNHQSLPIHPDILDSGEKESDIERATRKQKREELRRKREEQMAKFREKN